MSDPNQGQLIASSWEALHGDGPTDNVMNSHNLLKKFKDGGYVNYSDGGRLFEYSVEYQTNTTFRSMGEMEYLDTTRIDVFDVARFEQRLFGGTVVISDLEELRNAPENRKFDVTKKKLKNGTESALEGLDSMLFGDGTGNGGKDMDGLAKIIPTDPTTGTVGGINGATWTFWRSRALVGTKTAVAFDTLRAKMTTIFNQCSLGGTTKKPTGIITSREVFEGYESLLVAIENLVRDSSGSPDADIAFDADEIGFKGVGMGYDEQIPLNDSVYFLNKNFLQLTVLRGAWLKMKDKVEPGNQFVGIFRVLTVGNLCASARRHLGTVYSVSLS